MIRKISVIFAVIVLVLICTVFFTAYVFGIKAEDAYHKWVDHWAHVSSLRVVSKKYDRGWFSSNAETIFEYSNSRGLILTLSEHDFLVHGPIALRGIFQHKISREPFLARIKTEVRGQLNNQSELGDMIRLLPPLEVDTVFSLQGDGTSKISMQSFSYRHEKLKEFLTWEGLSGNSTFVPKGNKFRMDLNLPGLEVVDEDLSASFSKAEIVLTLDHAEKNINAQLDSMSLRTKDIEIHNLSGGSEEIRSLSMNDLESSWSSEVKDGLINGSQKIGFEKLTVNDSNKFGPGALEFSMRNINSDAINEINKSIDSLGGDLIADQQMQLRTLGRIIKYLPQLADDHAEFEITRLSLHTPDGEFMAKAKVHIDGNSSQLKLNPFYAIEAVNADVMISVPRAMLEHIIKEITREEIKETIERKGREIPPDDQLSLLAESASNEKIKSLLRLNIFAFTDNRYQLKLVYSKGALELNGTSIPIPFVSP